MGELEQEKHLLLLIVKAIKMLKGALTNIQKMKIEEQKKAVRSGYDMDILPTDIITYEKDTLCLLYTSKKVAAAYAELYELESILVLDVGRYGFVKLQYYTPEYGFNAVSYTHLCALRQKNSSLPENTGEIPKRNLDIEVPIGYNVVIVKVGKTLQKFR